MEGVGCHRIVTARELRLESRDRLGAAPNHPAPLALGGATPDAVSLTGFHGEVEAFVAHRATTADAEGGIGVTVLAWKEHGGVEPAARRIERPRTLLGLNSRVIWTNCHRTPVPMLPRSQPIDASGRLIVPDTPKIPPTVSY